MTNDLSICSEFFSMEDVFGQRDYVLNHDFGSLTGNMDYVRELLSRGESFDIWYSEDGSLNDREKEAEGISSEEAVNHFFKNLSDYDGFVASWNHRNNLDTVRIYENRREGLLGRILPKRGEEIIFEYRED